MKQLAHFVAESANFNPDGTFTVYRAGIVEMRAPAFPTLCKCSVITRMEFDVDEIPGLHQLRVAVLLNEAALGRGMTIPIAVNAAPGHVGYANSIGNFSLAVPAAGELLFAATFDGNGLPLLRIDVKLTLAG